MFATRRASAGLALLAAALAAPALADAYPVSGRWGESAGGEKGPIACAGRRVITFDGDQRRDSRGGVPAYRNRSVTAAGPSRWRIVDEFATGQISARAVYVLQRLDADRIELDMQPGGTIRLQRCK
jgi:hypothetical protein